VSLAHIKGEIKTDQILRVLYLTQVHLPKLALAKLLLEAEPRPREIHSGRPIPGSPWVHRGHSIRVAPRDALQGDNVSLGIMGDAVLGRWGQKRGTRLLGLHIVPTAGLGVGGFGPGGCGGAGAPRGTGVSGQKEAVGWIGEQQRRAVGDTGSRVGRIPTRAGFLVRGWLKRAWAVVDEDGVPRDRQMDCQLLF